MFIKMCLRKGKALQNNKKNKNSINNVLSNVVEQ